MSSTVSLANLKGDSDLKTDFQIQMDFGEKIDAGVIKLTIDSQRLQKGDFCPKAAEDESAELISSSLMYL
ncbi:MAG: hypothetical protein P0S96_06985 [Simkaniaceae bacterium]|nr:hypothetical protein [Candidatus Sacchlamyda saccharinae]